MAAQTVGWQEATVILSRQHGALAERAILPSVKNGTESAELAALGFLRPAEAGWRWTDDAGTDRKLLRQLADCDAEMELAPIEGNGVWIAAARHKEPEQDSQVCSKAGHRGDGSPGVGFSGVVFSGVGFTPIGATRRCLGEMAEYRSWLYRPRADDRRCEAWRLGSAMIDPWAVLGLFAGQAAVEHDTVPPASCFEGEITWSRLERLSDGAEFWAPAQLCFGRFAANWRNDSNGCAAGPTREQATLRALCELIERDATGIWWYGQCRRPPIPFDMLEVHPPRRDRCWLLDLTTDLGVPVVAAIACDGEGALTGLGFGCDLTLGEAATAAYRELRQMEITLAVARHRAQSEPTSAWTKELARLIGWLSQATLQRLPHLAPDPDAIAAPVGAITGDALPSLIERLARRDLTAYAIDLSHPEIDIPAVRVFAPGLCHYKPRFGFARLRDVPQALGWRRTGVIEDALPLLI